MRKPNGYGSIKKLKGKRRRPFVFVITETGKQRPVQYFETQIEAEIYQADYNKIHRNHTLPGHKVTFSEIYYRWLPIHIAENEPAKTTIENYRNAFRHCLPLHEMPVYRYRQTTQAWPEQATMAYMELLGISQKPILKYRLI